MAMDISSMNSLYTDFIKNNATASTPSVDGQRDYSKATDEELMEVCKKFESYFLEQVMKEMWKTVDTETSDSASMNTLTSYFKDELISKTAEEATETNSNGLAQMLFEQMKRNYNL
ncbi:MAG: rod-binding protein [Lachnospiraceae bacterium]|nr:rod-binding protein [Lachnospiraceae bacterium]